MTEKSVFWATTDVGDGPAAGYAANDLFEVFRSLFTGNAGADYGGVSPDYLSELEVTGTSSPVSVGTGAAIVYGIPYFNSAAVDVSVSTPVSATRVDRIVLRASWAAQTVRVTRIAGVEGGSAPAITQSAGVTWDIKLASVSITTAGVITVTDEREFVSGVGDLSIVTAKLADAAVTTAKLADSSVTSAKIVDGTIATADIADSAVTTAKLADSNVTTAKIVDANVTTAKILDSNVTTAKVADANITNAKLANMAQATVKGRASGAGTGVPVDLTAAQLVTIINTADGTGTGLDADLLDGQHASAFAATVHTHGTSGIDDGAVTTAKIANTAVDSTKLASNAVTTAKITDANVTTAKIADLNITTGKLADDSVDNTKLANMTQTTVKGRASGAGTGDPTDLSAAQLVAIVATADGSGSGLDADLLDGYHATSFASAPGAWQTLSLGAGVSAVSGATPKYRLNGDVVEFKGGVTSASSGTVIVADLPVGYKPASGESHTFCHVNTTQVVAAMYAYNDGTFARIVIYDFVANADYNLSSIRYSITA